MIQSEDNDYRRPVAFDKRPHRLLTSVSRFRASTVRVSRRHVFYFMGYDPQGDAGYFALFKREITRSAAVWNFTATFDDPMRASDGISSTWQVNATGPNWRVETNYEFLRWEDIVHGDFAVPLWRRVPLFLFTLADTIWTGTLFRYFRCSWLYGCFWLFFYIVLFLFVLAGLALGYAIASLIGGATGVLLGVFGGLVVFRLLFEWPGRHFFVLHLLNDFVFTRDYAIGRRSDFDERLEAFAARIVEAARRGGVDEIVLVGHSSGSYTVLDTLARSLARDPDCARCGPPIGVLTLGSSILLPAFYPRASRLRERVARVAADPDIAWIEFQAWEDFMNFRDLDPVAVLDCSDAAPRPNPRIYLFSIDEVLSAESASRFRFNFLRKHFQFIMGSERRSPYDYFMIVAGPVPFRNRFIGREAGLEPFDLDGTFSESLLAGPIARQRSTGDLTRPVY